jgi:hypothetical protein
MSYVTASMLLSLSSRHFSLNQIVVLAYLPKPQRYNHASLIPQTARLCMVFLLA